MIINQIYIDSPLGQMIACATDRGVCLLEFNDRKNIENQLRSLSKVAPEIVSDSNQHLEQLKQELSEYFTGKRKDFTVPLDMFGTDFQKEVWICLQKIPYGTTISYQQEAISMGKAKSVRAVANANGMNKIAIVIPCHRVIGSNGSLTGYAGGLDRKKWLLKLENREKDLFD